MSLYYYRVFGLVIQSELELPELNPSIQKESEIQIRIGPVPSNLKTVTFKGVLFESNIDEFLFSNDIVTFYVKDGNTILLRPKNNGTIQEIRLYVLGTALGVLLHQRGLLPLHGSSIVYKQNAFIFSGTSTTGKSSLAATFAVKGYKLLADDISVINKNSNSIFMVHPGIPHLKIWQDVQDALNFPNVTQRVRPQLDKYFISEQLEFHEEAQPLKAICFLNVRNEQGFTYTKLHGRDKFYYLRNNTFRIRILDSTGHTRTFFKMISELANSVDLYLINRPSIPLNLKELSDYVEQKILVGHE